MRRRDWFNLELTVVGHPFASIGMGDQLRSHVHALLQAGLTPRILDVYRYAKRTDSDHLALMKDRETDALGNGVRIFHINGDEVEGVLQALASRGETTDNGYNIIMPAWELPRYPAVWVPNLKAFDEIWSISNFVKQSFEAAGLTAYFIGQSAEMPPLVPLPRRYFGLREDAFIALTFLDLTSMAERKNPQAVLRLMDKLSNDADIRAIGKSLQFVLKVKNGNSSADDWIKPIQKAHPTLRTITHLLSAHETRSLIACSDCFISLHRAEGFGRGLAEAMYLGRLALGTAWSGNMDFMSSENSVPVEYQMVDVAPGAYPQGKGQQWAEPDIEYAARALKQAFLDDQWTASLSRAGRSTVLKYHSHRAVGVRSAARLVEIQNSLQAPAPGARPALQV